MGQPIAYNYFTLLFIGALIGFFIGVVVALTQYVVWRFWGVEKTIHQIENINNQLEEINYKMSLFVQKFDVVDNSKFDNLN